jgi:hypothetical protein
MAAKAALIPGSREGMLWLDARPTLAGLLVLYLSTGASVLAMMIYRIAFQHTF